MDFLYAVITILFFLTLNLIYLSHYSKKSAIKIVDDMGIGYNLGKTFNNFTSFEYNNTQNYQIKIWGTILPTKRMISKIRKYGFKTIRFQVVSINSTDEYGKVSNEWISGVREVINYIINLNMYCILSVYYEGKFFVKRNSRAKYINFWIQIAKEFISYDEHLIFESINEVFDFEYQLEINGFNINGSYDNYKEYQMNLFNSSQEFIYTFRNSGGYNSDRLLVISELVTEIDIYIYSSFFEHQLPIDPAKKFAISLNYYFPSEMYYFQEIKPFEWFNKYGTMYEAIPLTQ